MHWHDLYMFCDAFMLDWAHSRKWGPLRVWIREMYMLLGQLLHRQRPSIRTAPWAALLTSLCFQCFSRLELHSTLLAGLDVLSAQQNRFRWHIHTNETLSWWEGHFYGLKCGSGTSKHPSLLIFHFIHWCQVNMYNSQGFRLLHRNRIGQNPIPLLCIIIRTTVHLTSCV